MKKKNLSKLPRVDHWIKQSFATLTNRQIDEAIASGLVLDTEGRRVQKGDRVEGLSALDTTALARHLLLLSEGNRSLTVSILKEFPGYFLVDKPAGMVGHPLSLFDRETLTHWALHHSATVAREFTQVQPTIVPHRLDAGTSGLIIVAKTRAAFDDWRGQFQKKKVRKRYLAWCWGKPPFDSFEVNYGLAHDLLDARKMVVPALGERYVAPVQEAQSVVRVKDRQATLGAFLAEVECYTGVTHQVRVHLAKSGYPLVGDELYDAQFTERIARPLFHQLRATELISETEHFRAPTQEFETAYKNWVSSAAV